MIQALIAVLFAAGMVASVLVLNVVAGPGGAVGRLTPVVVGTLRLDDTPDSATFVVENMAPGDVAIRGLTVTNGGTLPFRYDMHAETTEDVNALSRLLVVTVVEARDGACDAAGSIVAGPAPLADIAFGSAASGAQDGDRRLEREAGELLCFRVELPIDTANDVADSAATLTFAFHAEEVRGR